MVDGAITEQPVTDKPATDASVMDGPVTDKMAAEAVASAHEAGGRPQGRGGSRRIEAAEVRAWRIEKVRRWPRLIRVFGLRILVVCVAVVAVLFVLGQVLPLTTPTMTKGVARSSAPHQM